LSFEIFKTTLSKLYDSELIKYSTVINKTKNIHIIYTIYFIIIYKTKNIHITYTIYFTIIYKKYYSSEKSDEVSPVMVIIYMILIIHHSVRNYIDVIKFVLFFYGVPNKIGPHFRRHFLNSFVE
jgi:hypothetical protein